jgi:hypothetical protein
MARTNRLSLEDLAHMSVGLVKAQMLAGARAGRYPTPEELAKVVGSHVLGTLLERCAAGEEPSPDTERNFIDVDGVQL